MSQHEFTIDQWMRRADRSRAPRFSFTDFTSMFGMTEIESAVAEVCNKAKDDCCLLADVHFTKDDFEDKWNFEEMRMHGWLVESHGRYKLDPEAVRRVHRRHPNL